MISVPTIWVPRYQSPERPHLSLIPPSPPAEQRHRSRRYLMKALRGEASYTGRIELPQWRGRIEDLLRAMRIGTPGAMTGGVGGLGSGLETQLLGANTTLNNANAYYKFESDGTDSSGNGNTLTLNNSPSFVSGKIGNAIQCVSASSKNASRASTATLSVGGSACTICCWFNFSTINTFNAILAKGPDSTALEYRFLVYSSGNTFEWDLKSGITKSVSISTGAWHFALCTFDGTNASIYFDGGTATSGSANAATGTGGTFFVGEQQGGLYLCDCTIDSLGIWPRVVTSTERDQLWNSGNGFDPY